MKRSYQIFQLNHLFVLILEFYLFITITIAIISSIIIMCIRDATSTLRYLAQDASLCTNADPLHWLITFFFFFTNYAFYLAFVSIIYFIFYFTSDCSCPPNTPLQICYPVTHFPSPVRKGSTSWGATSPWNLSRIKDILSH